jgi:hypothetical protein
VGDAMCGVKHMIKDEAACTKGCVTKGFEYAMIVKDKAYTLKASAAQKSELAKLSGNMAMITSNVTGDTVMVESVKMDTTKR